MRDNGIVIGQAYEVIKKTYKEINRLKDDIADLLVDYEMGFAFDQEYSYGPKTLYLKANHTFLFKAKTEGEDIRNYGTEKVLAVVCIFYEQWGLNRMSLKDQPEIWFGLVDILNIDDIVKPWDLTSLLKIEERENFKGILRPDGSIVDYYWLEEKEDDVKEDEQQQEWKGIFLGYPLVQISDKDFLKKHILDKLVANNGSL